MIVLSEEEKDALAEVLNVGMGSAAIALSEMVQADVTLGIPDVHTLSLEEAIIKVRHRTGQQACAVCETFDGPIAGDTLLIFPLSSGLELVRIMVGDDTNMDSNGELEQDALIEIGNVILTSCLVAIGDMLQAEVNYKATPELLFGNPEQLLSKDKINDQNTLILFMEVAFGLKEEGVDGFVVFTLGLESAMELKNIVSEFMKTFGM